MVQYPVSVPRRGYRGSNLNTLGKVKEHNRVAQLLEDYINNRVKESVDGVVQLAYGNIAHALSQPENLVRDILIGVDGGHNALTVIKRATTHSVSRG